LSNNLYRLFRTGHILKIGQLQQKRNSQTTQSSARNLLLDILDLLKEVQLEKSLKATWTSNFKKILKEDGDLLHKLK
jgi:hypothetical protein